MYINMTNLFKFLLYKHTQFFFQIFAPKQRFLIL